MDVPHGVRRFTGARARPRLQQGQAILPTKENGVPMAPPVHLPPASGHYDTNAALLDNGDTTGVDENPLLAELNRRRNQRPPHRQTQATSTSTTMGHSLQAQPTQQKQPSPHRRMEATSTSTSTTMGHRLQAQPTQQQQPPPHHQMVAGHQLKATSNRSTTPSTINNKENNGSMPSNLHHTVELPSNSNHTVALSQLSPLQERVNMDSYTDGQGTLPSENYQEKCTNQTGDDSSTVDNDSTVENTRGEADRLLQAELKKVTQEKKQLQQQLRKAEKERESMQDAHNTVCTQLETATKEIEQLRQQLAESKEMKQIELNMVVREADEQLEKFKEKKQEELDKAVQKAEQVGEQAHQERFRQVYSLVMPATELPFDPAMMTVQKWLGKGGQKCVFHATWHQMPVVLCIMIEPTSTFSTIGLNKEISYLTFFSNQTKCPYFSKMVGHFGASKEEMQGLLGDQYGRLVEKFKNAEQYRCILMQAAHEGDLARFIKYSKTYEPEKAGKAFLLEIVVALEYMLKEHGSVHLDLKPENILVQWLKKGEQDLLSHLIVDEKTGNVVKLEIKGQSVKLLLNDFSHCQQKTLLNGCKARVNMIGTVTSCSPDWIFWGTAYAGPEDKWAVGLVMFTLFAGEPLHRFMKDIQCPKDLRKRLESIMHRFSNFNWFFKLPFYELAFTQISNNLWRVAVLFGLPKPKEGSPLLDNPICDAFVNYCNEQGNKEFGLHRKNYGCCIGPDGTLWVGDDKIVQYLFENLKCGTDCAKAGLKLLQDLLNFDYTARPSYDAVVLSDFFRSMRTHAGPNDTVLQC